jgi:type VI protein secretion system component Hcp
VTRAAARVSIEGHMAKRRRWEEELEEEAERAGKPQLAQQLADLDEGKRAGVVEELQKGGGNRAFQQIIGGQLQRETAAASLPKITKPFMKIDGIRGPSGLKGHEGEFELEQNYELEVKTPTDVESGQPYAKRHYSDLKVVVRKSVGVTALRMAISRNQSIATIVLVAPVADGVETTTLKDVLVVGVKDLANGNVEIRFVFREIEWGAGELMATDSRPPPT